MTPMPKEIAGAVLLVMRAVGKLAKDAKNSQGNYTYASVDTFLEAVNPACAEAGLIVCPIELSADLTTFDTTDSTGKIKTRRQIQFSYNFMLVHESGATWCNERDVRHVAVEAVGAQAYGAAQSYALKQYMRALFQIPTGDEDADAHDRMQATMIRATVSAARAKRETGQHHITIDLGNGVETVAAPDVKERVLSHLESFEDQSSAMEWWQAQTVGREQFYGHSPKLALDLKKAVEKFFTAEDAAREPPGNRWKLTQWSAKCWKAYSNSSRPSTIRWTRSGDGIRPRKQSRSPYPSGSSCTIAERLCGSREVCRRHPPHGSASSPPTALFVPSLESTNEPVPMLRD